MLEVYRVQAGARRFQFTRHEVFEALREGGYLVGIRSAGQYALCACVKARRWRKPHRTAGSVHCCRGAVLGAGRAAVRGNRNVEGGVIRWRQGTTSSAGPWRRERDGHTGGGQLFMVRRESALQAGVLSAKGHSDNYLAFRPSNFFMRMLGDDVLRLNEALFAFRGQGVEHLVLMDDDSLAEHYGELKRRFEVIRDRVAVVVEYCNKGFDGSFEDAQRSRPDGLARPGRKRLPGGRK